MNKTRVVSKRNNDLNANKRTRQVKKSGSRNFRITPEGKILTYKDYNVMIAVFNGLDVVNPNAPVSREDYMYYLENGQLPGENNGGGGYGGGGGGYGGGGGGDFGMGGGGLMGGGDNEDEGDQIKGGSGAANELFKNITLEYKSGNRFVDEYPDITFYYKLDYENTSLDVGGSTDEKLGFITLTIEQYIDGEWYLIGIFGMSTGVDYRQTPFKVSGELISTWDLGRALRFTQEYVKSDETSLVSIVYYYFTDDEGLNGTLTYTQPSNDDLAVYAIKNIEYGWYALVKSVTFRGTGTLSNATYSINDAKVVIIEGYNTLANGVFKNANTVTTIVIPDTITTIGEEAFYGMSSLPEIEIPTGVTVIKDSTFYGMKGLSKLILPDTINSIGEYAFYGTQRLENLDLPNSLTSVGDNTFYGSSMRSLTIPNGVTSIGNSAFYEMKNLRSINLPYTITSIGEYAFYDTRSLSRIDIPAGLTSISDKTFSGASGLASVLIPDTTTSIGSLAFEATSSMMSIVLHAGINSIANDAFKSSAVETVFIPAVNNLGVTSPSAPGTLLYGKSVTVYTLTQFEAFTASSISYANTGDAKPTISLTFATILDEPRLDVGPSTTTTEGFQTFEVAQFVNGSWSIVYSFNMYNGQE